MTKILCVSVCILKVVCISVLLSASDWQPTSFFALLPMEVCNRIVNYLDFCETDEEFIARTRKYGEVTEKDRQLTESYTISIGTAYRIPFRYTYSIDNPEIIISKSTFFSGGTAINITNGKRHISELSEDLTYLSNITNKECNEDILCIASSRFFTHLAEIYRNTIW